MKKIIVGLAAVVLSLGLVSIGLAADNHGVTVEVDAITVVAVTGSPSLHVTTATAGSDPADVVDSTTADLSWTIIAASAQKISAKMNSVIATGITLTLAVDDTASEGTAASAVTLTADDQEIIGSISNEAISDADLTYTLVVDAATAAPLASVEKTVTFTIAADV